MYELTSENLTSLGSPMGTEHTSDNWRKFFKDIEFAVRYAEKDYKSKIEWKKENKNYMRSPDLGYVMYHIRKIKCED